MTINQKDVQAVFNFKALKAYCEHKEACDICVFYHECPYSWNGKIRDKIEAAACEFLVSGELGEDMKNIIPELIAQPKTGHWITLKDEYDDVVEAVCSCCDKNGNHKWKYCPNCGAKMERSN